jgi:hypothetical protein
MHPRRVFGLLAIATALAAGGCQSSSADWQLHPSPNAQYTVHDNLVDPNSPAFRFDNSKYGSQYQDANGVIHYGPALGRNGTPPD